MTDIPSNDADFVVHPYTGEVYDRDHVPDDARLALLEVAHGHLLEAVGNLTPGSARPNRPSRWSWQHLRDPSARTKLWQELRDFVDWLIERYQPTGDVVIRPCWYRHPVAVEELTALMAAWRAAYCSGDAPADLLIGWHQTWLWPTLERLNHRARWSQCGHGHQPAAGVVARPTEADMWPPEGRALDRQELPD